MMPDHERELIVARVSAGATRLRHDGQVFLVRRPTREQQLLAQELYCEHLEEAALAGLPDDAGALELLLEQGLWDESRQALLDKLPREIEDFKVRLFQSRFRSQERVVLRRAIAAAREELALQQQRRSCLTHLTREGHAGWARSLYLFATSLHRPDGRRVYHGDEIWQEATVLLDALLAAHAPLRLEDACLREVARTEPWRSTWGARKGDGLFGRPACDYTDEQRALVCYSHVFDSVWEHPDCPPDDVVEDDDMLDGWLIEQRRQRDSRQAKKAGEQAAGSEKIRSAQEIFLMAETPEDAKKIMELNDPHARAIQRQRFALMKQKGVVNEMEMTDVRQRLMMEATQKLSQSVKGGR